jgi:alanyl-tRNA synthetase
MASDTSRPEWTAPRVRETFLEYFKQNGHTFGAYPRKKLQTPPPALASKKEIHFAPSSIIVLTAQFML